MAGPNPILEKSFAAGATIAKHRIVKYGTADDTVIQAASKTDLVIGVATEASANGRVEVMMLGIAEIEMGGTVARGDFVTSDGTGRGVAGTAVTVKQRAIGIALESATVGQISPVRLAPSQFDLA